MEERHRQDAACGGIGKRRLTRKTFVEKVRNETAARAKRRQTGGTEGRELEGDDGKPLPDEPQPGDCTIPSYDSIPYTNPRQESPGRYRGRRAVRGKLPKHLRGRSLWRLIQGREKDLFTWCCGAGFLQDRRGSACTKCKVGVFEDVQDSRGCSYVCGRAKCRHRESVTEREPGLFLPRVALSKQMTVIYI